MVFTSTAVEAGIKSPTGPMKTRVSMNIRKIDNGYILNVNLDKPDKYESVELAITSLPKLLKAIGTFLREEEGKD